MKNQVVLDWDQYVALARQTVAEGCVLLENKDQALPLVKDEKVAVFGRIQNHYYKSGTGSGGMVNVSKVYGIVDGLRESGQVILDEELIRIYQDWEKTHPFNEGEGWGNEPWCQEEMELTDEVVEAAGKRSETAIVIIGRTAGEDKDASDTKGSYQLTDVEEDLLTKVRKNFDIRSERWPVDHICRFICPYIPFTCIIHLDIIAKNDILRQMCRSIISVSIYIISKPV